MSAALSLDFSGDPVPCGFPRCILDAFHDGDHVFYQTPTFAPDRIHVCIECGSRFVIYGEADSPSDRRICDKPECLLSLARREAVSVPMTCRCTQRSYAHELAVHGELKSESFNPKHRHNWPWSLMLSRRVEPSTEKERHA